MDIDSDREHDNDQPSEEDTEQLTALGTALTYAILARAPPSDVDALLAAGAPLWYQEDEHGLSALHAAAYVEDEGLVRRLLGEGAVWNAADNMGNTPGDVALSLNNEGCYNAIVDAGLRSELLLSLLGSHTAPPASTLILKQPDSTAAGSTDAFLSSPLKFRQDEHGQDVCLVNAGDDEVGVMMGWERPIMQATVDALCSTHPRAHDGPRVLNIGFGLGIIDTLFQALPTPPASHIIVEPHRDVLAHMRTGGWYERSGVRVLEGKWQDMLSGLEERFDIVFTDTFSEDYSELKDFFCLLPRLMSGPDARFSFFNGLGATNATFYDVYSRLADIHLAELGLDVSWRDVPVDVDEGINASERWGGTRSYFAVPVYKMPLGVLSSTAASQPQTKSRSSAAGS